MDKYIQLQSADGVDDLFPMTNWELIWTNSSPTTEAGAVSFTLNPPRPPKFLLIRFRQNVYSSSAYYVDYIIPADDTWHIVGSWRYDGSNNPDIGRAIIYHTQTGKLETQVGYYRTSITAVGTNNAFLVPNRVYAIY